MMFHDNPRRATPNDKECKHPTSTVERDEAFSGPVADQENRAAHGGITLTRRCLHCGRVQKININGKHYEFVDWHVNI